MFIPFFTLIPSSFGSLNWQIEEVKRACLLILACPALLAIPFHDLSSTKLYHRPIIFNKDPMTS